MTTSQRRNRFFSPENNQGRTLSSSSSNNSNSSSSASNSINGNARSRSNSPPDMLLAEFSKSDSTLDDRSSQSLMQVLVPELLVVTPQKRRPMALDVSKSILGSASATTRSTSTISSSSRSHAATASGGGGGMDHSWTHSTSRGSRRRASGTPQLVPVQRNHSGDGMIIPLHHQQQHHAPHEVMQPSPKPTERSYSGGPRHRATASSASSSTSTSSSPRLIPPKRNVSGGDFADMSMSGRDISPAQQLPLHHNNHGGSLQLPYGNNSATSSPTNSFRKKHYANSSSSSSSSSCSNYYWKQLQGHNKQMIVLFGFVALAILGIAVYQHDAMLQEALRLKEQEVHHHIAHAKELESRVSALRSKNLQLEEQMDRIPTEQEMELETQRKLFHWEHANHKMQHDIQTWSKRLLMEKYGHGPKYYVQMKLSFAPESNVHQDYYPGDDVVIIETASIDDMPHSVFLFLEQIDHHLYDHATFHRNSPHLIQAGPSNDPLVHARFRHHPSLNSVIFQEYAPEIMSHKQYTLGYAGRPGGPDFYVNMRDNSAIHGPGGQRHPHSDISRDADPCFAKIVRGFEAIERVHRAEVVDPATNDAIVHPVLIESIKVLPYDYRLPPSGSSKEQPAVVSKQDDDHRHNNGGGMRRKDHYLLDEYVEDVL